MRALLPLVRRASAVAARQHAIQPSQHLQPSARAAPWRTLCAAPAAKPSAQPSAQPHAEASVKLNSAAERIATAGSAGISGTDSGAATATSTADNPGVTGSDSAAAAAADTADTNATESPCGLTADDVYNMSANRATRYVYLRTLPLAKQSALSSADVKSLAGAIEAGARVVITRHLWRAVDERAAVHLHTTALAVATHRALTGVRLSAEVETGPERVENVIRAGFGARLTHDPSVSDEDNVLAAGDDGSLRPDFWIVRAALWFALDKMGAVAKMTENMVRDFGGAFETRTEDVSLAGVQRHVVSVSKCLYDDVCRAEGLPSLTRVFCALDRAMYAPLNRSRTGIKFALDRTLADEDEGDDGKGRRCEFKFSKGE